MEKFFSKVGVAAVTMTEGSLKVGDTIHIKGHTTDFEETVSSMQIEQKEVGEVSSGDLVGIQVKEKARPGDRVLKVTSD